MSGYRIFYSPFDLENLDSWQSIDIGPYRVAEITGLEKQSYAIRVAAKSLDGRLGNASAVVLASAPTCKLKSGCHDKFKKQRCVKVKFDI